MKRKSVPWMRQPQFAAPLAARFSAGMVALVNPGVGARDLIGGSPLISVTGTPSFGTDPSGLVLRTPGSNDSYYASATPVQYASASATLLIVFTATSASGSDYASLGGVTNSGSNASPYVYTSIARGGAGVGANTNLMLSWNAFGSPTNLAMTTNLVAGVTYAVLASAASGNQEIYLAVQHGNAFTVIEKVTGTTSGVLQATTGARIYVGDTFNARAPNTQTSLLALWNRRFTDGDARQLLSNPWQIATPLVRKRRRVVIVSGIAFDTAANSGYQAASSSYTFSRTVTGANTFLAVDAEILSVGGTVSSVIDDFGGGNVALSFIGGQSTITALGRVENWGLAGAVTGTKTIQINYSGSIASIATATSYTGVNQTLPTEGFNSAQATNVGAADATVNITPIADQTWIHSAVVTNDTSITPNQTSRNNVSQVAVGSGANEDSNGPISPAAATATSYTGVGAAQTWAIAGYAMRPVGAPTGTTYTISPTGGITFSGAAVKIKGKVVIPTGGIAFAGTGSATFAHGGTTYTITPSGGITFAGVGTQVKGKVILPTGGISFSGTGARVEGKVILPVGGIVFGGTGSMSSNTQTGPTQTGERTKVGIGT